jgi:hypothetical protein
MSQFSEGRGLQRMQLLRMIADRQLLITNVHTLADQKNMVAMNLQ